MTTNKRRLFPADLEGLTRWASSNCPLCRGPNADFAYRRSGDKQLIQGWCPACTNVWITNDALDKVMSENRGYLLSAYLRRLPAEDWDDKVGMIAIDEVERLTSSVAEQGTIDQFNLALKLICEMCPVVGQVSRFSYQEDWPLLTAKSPETALYIIIELASAGYLRRIEGGPNPEIPPRPTWKAYERLEQIQSSGRNSLAGFVAMSFSKEQLPVWSQIIEPAIAGAGYKAIRVDRYEHNRRIDDEIIAQIRRCRFLVADFTEQKKGVYFEAGFALGLGCNVIWMCRESEVNDLHFDTRQFNHILYEDFDKAKRDLTNRIVALEGPGAWDSK